jgi:S-(hydroxymethyl)glutathione dehydrogenase/alcohol dehydrogenase
VLIKVAASGICRTDDHVVRGDLTPRFPVVGGHEGAGVVEAVGDGVRRLTPGDHVVFSFLPACGHCRFCSRGRQNLCDLGALILSGSMLDGTYRFHRDGEQYGGFSLLGSFSERLVASEHSCIKIQDDIPLEVAALVGCGVPTGWGSAVHAGEVKPGDTAVVYGVGGVGINAVQGARHAGAANIVAVDPARPKLAVAQDLGATHAATSPAEAAELIHDITRGVGADVAIVTVSLLNEVIVGQAFAAVAKGGRLVLTAASPGADVNVQLPGALVTLFEKEIRGSLYGSCNPFEDVPRLLDLYRTGALHLDELITSRYPLEEINLGFKNLEDENTIRGLIVHASD